MFSQFLSFLPALKSVLPSFQTILDVALISWGLPPGNIKMSYSNMGSSE